MIWWRPTLPPFSEKVCNGYCAYSMQNYARKKQKLGNRQDRQHSKQNNN